MLEAMSKKQGRPSPYVNCLIHIFNSATSNADVPLAVSYLTNEPSLPSNMPMIDVGSAIENSVQSEASPLELTTVEEIAWLDVSVNDVERVHPPECNEKLAHVLLHFRHAQLADVILESWQALIGASRGTL